MTQKLLTLPFRLGFGAARTALDISVKTVGVSAKLAGTAVEILRPHDRPSEPSPPERSTDAAPASDAAPEERREAKAPRPRPAAPPRVNGHSAATAAPAPPAPPTPLTHDQEVVKTLEDEDELVAEFAEAGAEDGAGAQLDVDEPWEGYAQMKAPAVISRIDEADQAELAVLELYEQTHKKRQKVLSAASKRLRALSPSQAPREAD